jgi:hypothetical protein
MAVARERGAHRRERVVALPRRAPVAVVELHMREQAGRPPALDQRGRRLGLGEPGRAGVEHRAQRGQPGRADDRRAQHDQPAHRVDGAGARRVVGCRDRQPLGRDQQPVAIVAIAKWPDELLPAVATEIGLAVIASVSCGSVWNGVDGFTATIDTLVTYRNTWKSSTLLFSMPSSG